MMNWKRVRREQQPAEKGFPELRGRCIPVALERVGVWRGLCAGLSQRALAKLAGTTASVICRREDSDYEGHSLAMLRRIAAALNKRVEIRFVPARKRA